jgi:hypothetical protein
METTVTLQENIEVVDTIRETAMSLPADAVKLPDMPVMTFLEELTTTVIATEEHWETLSAVGFTTKMQEVLKNNLQFLNAAQAVWNAEKSKGRTEINIDLIEKAENTIEDLLAASALALRKNAEGQRRLSMIREGDSMADLVVDLQDGGILISDARPHFYPDQRNPDRSTTICKLRI